MAEDAIDTDYMTEAELYARLNTSSGYYDWYGVEGMDIPGHINTARKVYMALSVTLTIADGLLLATLLCKQTRNQSAAWYLYHLACPTVVFGLVINPMLYMGIDFANRGTCIFLSGATRTFVFMHSVSIVLLNIEVLFTVVWPKECFANQALLRFAMTTGFAWSVAMVFVIILMSSTRLDGHFGTCWYMANEAEIILHASQIWLPGTFVICCTVAIVTIYIRSRCTPTGSYNQLAQYTNRVENYQDWFACILTINALFVIVEVLVYEMQQIVDLDIMTILYLQICCNVTHFALPLTMFTLHPVRKAIWMIATKVYQYMTCQKAAGIIVEEQILSMDTLSEETV